MKPQPRPSRGSIEHFDPTKGTADGGSDFLNLRASLLLLHNVAAQGSKGVQNLTGFRRTTDLKVLSAAIELK
jgi:hypothetical protein